MMLSPWMPSSGPGWVYVLEEPITLPNISKIGRTARTAAKRAPEVSRAYGVAEPFAVYSKHFTPDAAAVEWMAHRMLRKRRFPRSELFAVPPDKATETVKAAIRAYRPPSVFSRWLRRRFTPPADRRAYRWRRSRGGYEGLIAGGLGLVFIAGVVWLRPSPPPWVPVPVAHVVKLLEGR